MEHEQHKDELREQLAKPRKGKVGGIIRRLMHEQAEGTGPHAGKGGPLVTSRKQLLAIAFSKARKG